MEKKKETASNNSNKENKKSFSKEDIRNAVKNKSSKHQGTQSEVIGPVKFNESFKTLIREYYCYGFKTLNQMAISVKADKGDSKEETKNNLILGNSSIEKKGNKNGILAKKEKEKSTYTIKNDGKRLQNIINQDEKNFLTWKSREDDVVCTTVDSSSLAMNPFLNVYRFCECKKFEDFLLTIATLSPEIQQRWEGPFDVDEYYLLFNEEGQYYTKQGKFNRIKRRKLDKAIDEQSGQKTTDLLMLGSVEFTELSVKKSIASEDSETKELKKLIARKRKEETNAKEKAKDAAKKAKAAAKESEEIKKAAEEAAIQAEKEAKEAAKEVKRIEKEGIKRTQEEKDRIKKDEESITRTKEEEDKYKSEKRVANNRLQSLCEQGFLWCDQNTGEKDQAGDQNWALNNLTIQDIIQAGEKKDPEFMNHLIAALDFYSRYYFLGEVGIFLLDRIQSGQNDSQPYGSDVKNYESPFRFKQEYFIQTMNDYDLIDLLGAIEAGDWCLIKYRHTSADPRVKYVYFLCYPLEIRVSAANGREYLMYYEPILRSCLSLRIDFISSITIYTDENVKTALQNMENPEYKRNAAEIEAGIQKSREILDHIWGVSTSVESNLENNVVNGQKLYNFRLKLKYNSATEPYIKDRLWRESRNGSYKEAGGIGPEKELEYTVNVYDPQEINPWKNSFFGRITYQGGYHKTSNKSKDGAEKNNFQKWDVPDEIVEALEALKPHGQKPKQHDYIFNQVFSVYGQILATFFTKMLTAGEWENDAEWKKTYRIWKDEVIDSNNNVGRDTKLNWEKEFSAETIKRFFLYEDKKDHKLRCKFHFNEAKLGSKKEQISFYKDILPLSGIEVRWLKTILNDDCKDDDKHSGKIKCFLSDDEIKAVKEVLNKREETELPSKKIIYFDRYKFPLDCRLCEQKAIRIFLNSLWNQEKVEITFNAIPDDSISSKIHRPFVKDNAITQYPKMETFSGTFIPLRILFSKRDNFFTLCFWSCDDQKIYFVNASRILTISSTGEKFNPNEKEAAERTLTEYYSQRKNKVELKFQDVYNIPDRILMELSPWEKECTYLSSLKEYKLVLSYLSEDKLGLALRLIGYTFTRDGINGLTFEQPDNEIAIEIRRRKKKQQAQDAPIDQSSISRNGQHDKSK